MFWVLILFFRKVFEIFKKFFSGYIEIITQFNQSCKGNITFPLFNPTNMDIGLVKGLKLS